MQDRDLDALVERVVERVRGRLTSGGAAEPVTHPRGVCRATGEQCEGTGLCAARRPADVRRLKAAGMVRVSGCQLGPDVPADLAGMIDHTLLKAEVTREELVRLCDEAARHGFATVCVNPANVPFCVRQLKGTPVKVITVVGFPLGATSAGAKAFEARQAVREGAAEIDMVIHIGALKSRDHGLVLQEIQEVVQAVKPVPVKVIIEASALTRDEKVMACTLAKAAGAAFVKTSTGFGKGGATLEDVALMREVVGADMGVKASGGIHSAEEALGMVKAGATRIGASASVAIVTGTKRARSGPGGGY